MKKSLLIVLAAFSFTVHAETKKICHDKVVKGKTVSVCKNVKIHQAISNAVAIPTKKK
jgi:hypothetical protein